MADDLKRKEGNILLKGKGSFLGVLILATFFLLAGASGQVKAQIKYPVKPIDIIVPMPPGGGTDAMARITSDFFKKKWGVAVNVINKPGGNTVLALLDLHSAAADGYTLFADVTTSACLLGSNVKNLPLKVLDRAFISMTAIGPHLVIVTANSPAKNLKDLETEVKKDPDNFTWSSQGVRVPEILTPQFLLAGLMSGGPNRLWEQEGLTWLSLLPVEMSK